MHDCSVDEAFTLLRTYCRNHNLLLSTVAATVVADPTSIPGVTSKI